MDDYDPGSPFDDYDKKRRRNRRRMENEVDDAWAAADQDDLYDDAAEIEDLAAGYVDAPWRPAEPPMNTEQIDISNLGPISGAGRRMQERAQRRPPRPERIRRHYDPEEAYVNSPSYHADKRNVLDRILEPMGGSAVDYYPPKPKRGAPGSPSPAIPLWGIIILVILGVVALLAIVMACVATILLMRG